MKKRQTIKSQYRKFLGERIARAMAPQEWQAYEKGQGMVTNADGWIIKDTLRYAKAVLDVLEEEKLI